MIDSKSKRGSLVIYTGGTRPPEVFDKPNQCGLKPSAIYTIDEFDVSSSHVFLVERPGIFFKAEAFENL